MKKFSIPIVLFAAALVVGLPLTSFALLGEITHSVRTTTEHVRGTVESARDAAMPEEVQVKRQEIQARIDAKRSAITDKLSGQRAETCEKKETTINQVLDNRSTAAERHFNTFKSIRDRLDAFVAEKQLNIDNAEALRNILNDSEGSALAAIENAKVTDFSCESTDAHSPGKIVTEQVAAQKEALKTYRTDLKNYAVAVKSAAVNNQTVENAAEEGSREQ